MLGPALAVLHVRAALAVLHVRAALAALHMVVAQGLATFVSRRNPW